MIYGLISLFSFVLIGYFDDREFEIIHFTLALSFFVCTTLYANFLAGQFKKYSHCFPEREQVHIQRLDILSYLMYAGMILLIFSKPLGISTEICEWSVGVMFMCYFALASFVNPYYDSVMAAEPKTQ